MRQLSKLLLESGILYSAHILFFKHVKCPNHLLSIASPSKEDEVYMQVTQRTTKPYNLLQLGKECGLIHKLETFEEDVNIVFLVRYHLTAHWESS